MHILPLNNHIYHVRFRSQKNLARTFCRLQEHFESPYFKGKFFSLKRFQQWYITHSPEGRKTGRFTFYQDWGGFNIPSYVFKPFHQGKFNPLLPEEKALLNYFSLKQKEKFYIIGTYGNHTKDLLQHEIAHALFYTNKKYRKEVLNILHKVEKTSKEQIYHYFQQTKGYHQDVWLDETHTYIMTLLDHLKKEGIDTQPLIKINWQLNAIFRKYSPQPFTQSAKS